MHYTLTGNLLAEVTAVYPQIRLGATERACEESFQVGGKGINVAAASARLGHAATAICFPAGHTGRRCMDWLRQQAFAVQAFEIAGETRLGWVARTSDQPETTLLGKDLELPLSAWQAAMAWLRQAAAKQPATAVTIAGSIPGWGPGFAAALEAAREVTRGTDAFWGLDTYGAPLADLVDMPFDLVKINRREWAGLTGSDPDDNSLRATLLRDRAEASPIRYWVITDGPRAVLAFDRQTKQLLQRLPPAVKEVSPVGCGDILMAALVHDLSRRAPLADALDFGMQLASKSAASSSVIGF